MMRRLGLWVGVLAAATIGMWPMAATAWWNGEWAYRKPIALDGAQTPALGGAVDQVLVPIRLHAGNFPFVDAAQAGSDLRLVGADNRTPLNFHLEQFDSLEELAIAWVQVPRIGSKDAAIWLYYGNGQAPAAESAKATFDPHMVAAFHFGEREGLPLDATGYGNTLAANQGRLRAPGAVGFGLGLAANQGARIAAAPSLATPAGSGWTVSLWVRPVEAAASGWLLTRVEGTQRLQFGLEGGRPTLRLGAGKTTAQLQAAEPLAGGSWHHLAFSFGGDRTRVFVDGRPVAEGELRLPEMRGEILLGASPAGAGLAADIDELQIANLTRAPEWLRASAIAQHPDSALAQYGADEAGGGSDYGAVVRTLAGAVSTDGWVIIGIIAAMGLLTGEVILVKSRLLGRVTRQNGSFLANYRDPASPVARMQPEAVAAGAQAFAESTLFRIYDAAHRGLATVRAAGVSGALSTQAIEVLKAGIEAEIVGQAHRLNQRLVLLTLIVAGAPFLGLLGTVVGIMITFGAIAMAGDVNVNTIAPGVAAALSTTVSGLIVAIPAMFGYNVLATRIKEVTAGMEVFANELLGRVALQSSTDGAAA